MTLALAGIDLLRPLWLLALAPAALAAWWAWRQRRGMPHWGRILDPKLAPTLTRLGFLVRSRGGSDAAWLGALAAIIAVALSGPATRNESAPTFRNLDVVFLVVDLSDSVTRGGAIDDVRAAAARVLGDAGGRPVALAVFAGEAYLVSGATDDPSTLETSVAVMDAETMPDKGSRPDRALALVRDRLAESAALGADVVLISDGGGIGPEALHEAELLRRAGAPVSALFVAPTDLPYGAPPPSREALEGLARAGGGALADAARPEAVMARLHERIGAEAHDRRLTSILFADRGRLVLALALLPALILFRRRASRP